MKMKIDFRHAAMILALGACFTSCSDNDEPEGSSDVTVTVDFEAAGRILAGPTSYGANLYYGYDGKQYTEAEFPVTGNVNLHIGLNVSSWTGEIDFYGGGMALSQWNIRSNTDASQADGWWYTYENQCSVYNLDSTDCSNNGAGARGSNTFVIANGYNDDNNDSASRMYFTSKAEFALGTVQLCNSSYVYGVMANGNPYGVTPDKNMEEAGGWFCVEFYGFDAEGNATNDGIPVEFYLCDYRAGSATYTPAITTWTACDLSALGKVNAVEVNFRGSDTGTWGLNTPAYVCLDNLEVKVPAVK